MPGADEPVRLVLGPPASTAVRVLQPDGKPAAGARVRVVQVNLKAPRPPDKMLDRLAATTDADGRATIDGFAPADIFALDVTAARADRPAPADRPRHRDRHAPPARPAQGPDRRRRPEGPAGLDDHRLVAADRAGLPRSVHDPLGPRDDRRGRPGRRSRRSPRARSSGRSRPPRARTISWPRSRRRDPARARRRTVEIPVVRAVRVEGTVLEEPGGAPVPGVKVDLDPLRRDSADESNRLVTDAQGRFSTLRPAGHGPIQLLVPHDMPKDYFLPPATPHWVDFEVKEGRSGTNSPRPGSGRRCRSGAGWSTRRASRSRGSASRATGPRPSIGQQSELGPGRDRRPGRIRPGQHRPEGRGAASRRRRDRSPSRSR